MNRKLHYLVRWEGFGVEHNSWEPWDNIHTPGLVADFHRKHPRAPCHIRTIDFNSIPFHSTLPFAVSGHHSLEGGVDVRGHLTPPQTSNSSDLRFDTLPYIPLHCRLPS